jgi:hypothetical protein
MAAPNHSIIKEASDSVSQLLSQQFKDAGYKRVHIIVNAPKPDQIEGKLPAVCLYMYQCSLDDEGLDSHVREEIIQVEQPDGTTREFFRRAPLWVRLDYLVSTWAQNPEDEQLLLGLAVQTFVDNPVLERNLLKGDSWPSDDFYLPMSISTRLEEGALARFWGSLNQPIRPAFQVWTSVPIQAKKLKPFSRVEETPGIRYRDLGGKEVEWEIGPKREPDAAPPQFRTRPVRSK